MTNLFWVIASIAAAVLAAEATAVGTVHTPCQTTTDCGTTAACWTCAGTPKVCAPKPGGACTNLKTGMVSCTCQPDGECRGRLAVGATCALDTDCGDAVTLIRTLTTGAFMEVNPWQDAQCLKAKCMIADGTTVKKCAVVVKFGAACDDYNASTPCSRCNTDAMCVGTPGVPGACPGAATCNVAGDCPQVLTNDCVAATCQDGVCGTVGKAATTHCGLHSGKCNGLGTCVECATATAATDCAYLNVGECEMPVCTAGFCASAPDPTAKTCSAGFCDGAGHCAKCHVYSDCDASSLPVCYHYNCTAGSCVIGKDSNTTVCHGVGFTGKCDGNGACQRCTATSDCGPAPSGYDAPCYSWGCTGNACAMTMHDLANCTYAEIGTATYYGSCVRGHCVSCVHTTDCDAVPYVTGSCMSAQCTHSSPDPITHIDACVLLPAPTTMTCSGDPLVIPALHCNGQGGCYECESSDDCSPITEIGLDTICGIKSACSNHVCVYTPAGIGCTHSGPLADVHSTCDGAGHCRECDISDGTTSDCNDVDVFGGTCAYKTCVGYQCVTQYVATDSQCIGAQHGYQVCTADHVCMDCHNAQLPCPCATAADCTYLISGPACHTYTCPAGRCVENYLPAGATCVGSTTMKCTAAHACISCDGTNANPCPCIGAADCGQLRALPPSWCTASFCTNNMCNYSYNKPFGAYCNDIARLGGRCDGVSDVCNNCLVNSDCTVGVSWYCLPLVCVANTCQNLWVPDCTRVPNSNPAAYCWKGNNEQLAPAGLAICP